MKDPIPKGGFGHKSSYGSYGQTQPSHQNKSNNFGGKKKSDYCWNFNRGVPCKFGTKCKFIERCKYCDSPSHGVNNCVKLLKKSEVSKPAQETKTDSINTK